MIRLVIWCGIGLLIYLGFGDYTVFSWEDPWVFIYMAFWPFVVLFWAGVYVIIIAVIVFGIGYLFLKKSA